MRDTPKILAVDDDEEVLHLIEKVLMRGGMTDITLVTDPRRVLPIFRDLKPDLIVLDLNMPGLDGHALLRQLHTRLPSGEFVPVIVCSGEVAPEARQAALALGASDFIQKPFEGVELTLRVRNLLRVREMAAQIESRVSQAVSQARVAELEHVSRLAFVAELSDYGDGAHVQRVGRTSTLIATRLGLSDEDVHNLRYAAPLHDIGKIGIPDNLLLKRDTLSLEEWDLIKTHTTIGAQICSGSHSPILQMAEEIALYHHENWDGTGYTPGLAGPDIPLVARIVSVADVFDALTHERPYKAAWAFEDAIDWIAKAAGSKFDPAVVDAMLEVLAMQETDATSARFSTIAGASAADEAFQVSLSAPWYRNPFGLCAPGSPPYA